MALELLAGPFDVLPVIDRVRVMTGVADTRTPGGDIGGQCMLIEGRGILSHVSSVRYLVQPDGAYSLLGYGRFSLPTQASVRVLLWAADGRRTYGEFEQTAPTSRISTGSVHELHPVTLAGFNAVANAPPGGPQAAVLLPGGVWLSTSFHALAISRYDGAAWVREADLPVVAGNYLSWAEAQDEIWIANLIGEACRYNWRTRRVTALVRTDVECMGMWYWRKHGVFLSLHSQQGGTRSVRVWAATPRPTKIEQTVLPPPTAGRVSRISTRLLGSYNEPCAGETVQWSAPGYEIVPLSPITDESGYARADLIVPMGATGGGSVTASVVI